MPGISLEDSKQIFLHTGEEIKLGKNIRQMTLFDDIMATFANILSINEKESLRENPDWDTAWATTMINNLRKPLSTGVLNKDMNINDYINDGLNKISLALKENNYSQNKDSKGLTDLRKEIDSLNKLFLQAKSPGSRTKEINRELELLPEDRDSVNEAEKRYFRSSTPETPESVNNSDYSSLDNEPSELIKTYEALETQRASKRGLFSSKAPEKQSTNVSGYKPPDYTEPKKYRPK